MEAWAIERSASPQSVRTTPVGSESSGVASESIIPDDPREQEIYAMRLVAQRCLYGVDINPLAAEMAKLSLWLLTMSKDKPFEFLDHNIRSGDSLVGLSDLDQLRYYSLKPVPENEVLFRGPLDHAISEAIDLRLKLEDMPSNTVEDVQRQEELLKEATLKMAKLRYAADMLVSAEFWGQNAKDKLHRTQEASRKSAEYFDSSDLDSFRREADEERKCQKMFHWPLEFPEVIVKRGGFDAFVGNPPFLGGKRLTTELGEAYTFGIKSLISSQKGAADLCAYFFLRSSTLSHRSGFTGFIATNSLSEGDTREIGLAALLGQGRTIIRASKDAHWPGSAGVTVSLIHIANGAWSGRSEIDDRHVSRISSYLEDEEPLQDPNGLKQNDGIASTGVGVNGTGFILEHQEYDKLISADPRNGEVIQPYLTSRDINQTIDSTPTRFIINFKDMNEAAAARYVLPYERVKDLVKPVRDKLTRQVHESCFWKHWDRREAFFDKVEMLERVIVAGRVSNQHAFAFMKSSWLPFDGVVVFLWDDFGHFALLQSTIHEVWVRRYMTTLRQDPRYSVSDCFLTFPLVTSGVLLSSSKIAERYIHARSEIQSNHSIGLTDVYHLFGSVDETSPDIQEFRELQVEMDIAVAAAYGWTDLKLDHGFHETKQGIRYTISEPARREVLQRLLKLNHERYAEEEKQGLHGKKKGAARKTTTKKSTSVSPRKKKTPSQPEFQQPELFGEGEVE